MPPTSNLASALPPRWARAANSRRRSRTLYIFDEPTTGLHFDDVSLRLLLFVAADAGGSVLAIEHNLDVIKTADWVIDLGPEGGNGGGKVVAIGPPGSHCRGSEFAAGQWLTRVLHTSGVYGSNGRK